MLIYGRNPVFEAVKTGKAERIFIRKGAVVYDKTFNLPVSVLSKGDFDAKFPKEAQGLGGETADIAPIDFDINKIKSGGVVILDRIQDPQNYGAILRSAVCFGVQSVITPRYNRAPITPAVVKASAGAVFYLDIFEITNLRQACAALKIAGYTILAASSDGSISLRGYLPPPKIAAIIGSEGRGVRQSLSEEADGALKIDIQEGKIDSLNAAQAAAIVFFALFG
ncbi:MAG: RNA methyltransferase [Deferribacteraceae bacterium]|jgi:23S rRNA (guanosine2251-2'-O)-methyltransferase|nr:RNA methyltransferase [Deferribacteraceae bacterium]